MNNKPIARDYNQLFITQSFVSPVTSLDPIYHTGATQPTRNLNTIINDIKADRSSFEQDFNLNSRNYRTQIKSLDNDLEAIKNGNYECSESLAPLAKYEQTVVAVDKWLDKLHSEEDLNYLRKDHLFGGTIEISDARKDHFKDKVIDSLFTKKQKKKFVKLYAEKTEETKQIFDIFNTEIKNYILSEIDKFEENTTNWDDINLNTFGEKLDNDYNITPEVKDYFSRESTGNRDYIFNLRGLSHADKVATIEGYAFLYLKQKKSANDLREKLLGNKETNLIGKIKQFYETHIYKTGENPI